MSFIDKDMEIRVMKNSDWERVVSIYRQGIASNNATFETDIPEYDKWNMAHHKDGRLVLTQNDMVIGWCALSSISSRPAYAGVAEVSIYLEESCRGKGLGYHLLTSLCKVSEENFWTLQASIFIENVASIKLHEKCGFRMVGYRERIAKDCLGNWRDTVLMERRKHG